MFANDGYFRTLQSEKSPKSVMSGSAYWGREVGLIMYYLINPFSKDVERV